MTGLSHIQRKEGLDAIAKMHHLLKLVPNLSGDDIENILNTTCEIVRISILTAIKDFQEQTREIAIETHDLDDSATHKDFLEQGMRMGYNNALQEKLSKEEEYLKT